MFFFFDGLLMVDSLGLDDRGSSTLPSIEVFNTFRFILKPSMVVSIPSFAMAFEADFNLLRLLEIRL